MNTLNEANDSKLISFGPFDIIMQVSLSFSLQIFDNRNSKVFVKTLNNQEISEITQNLCSSQQELFSLLVIGFTNKTKNSDISISENGIIHYKCSISFPIDRSYSFDIELLEKEISDVQKLDFQIKKIGGKLNLLQKTLKEKTNYDSKEEIYQGAFSMILNSGYYSFSNQYKTITRNGNDLKAYKTIWGNRPLEKKNRQSFCIKIDKIQNDLCCAYAFIGIGYSLNHGLNIYNCKGALTITNGRAFVDGKELFMNDFLFLDDIIKVTIDFDKNEAKWFRNNEEIFLMRLPYQENKNFEIYPIVSLSHFNETVSLIQN